MSLDNEVQQEAAKRGILGRMKDTISDYVSTTGQKAKTAAAIATVLAAGVVGGRAEGATLATNHVPSSSSPTTYAVSPNNQSFEAVAGLAGKTDILAPAGGDIFRYNQFTAAPSETISSPVNLTGLVRFYDANGDEQVSGTTSTSITEGTISGGNYNITNIISLSAPPTYSSLNITGISMNANGEYILSDDGIGTLGVNRDDGSTYVLFGGTGRKDVNYTEVDNPNVESELVFSMGTAGVSATDANADGTQYSGGNIKVININGTTGPTKGLDWFDSDTNINNGVNGGFAAANDLVLDWYQPLVETNGINLQNSIAPRTSEIPEPLSGAMLGVGLAGLILKRTGRENYKPQE